MTSGNFRHSPRPIRALVLSAFCGAMLLAQGGCVAPLLFVGASTTGAVVGAQERSPKDALKDTWIATQVQHHLAQTPKGKLTHVGVEVHEGRVMLTGVVKTEEDREEAGSLAAKPNGVKEVLNELQIRDEHPEKQYLKDATITTRIRKRLMSDAEIYDINYYVETVNGMVYLLGIARSDGELTKVTDHARSVSGVQEVISHVRVKPPEEADEGEAPPPPPPAQ